MAKRGYDRETGQVYFDVTVPQYAYSRDSPGNVWAHQSSFLPECWERTNANGAHSLKHMAMRELLSDQRRLTVAHFEHIAWPLAEYLWNCLCRIESTSLHAWKIFATAYTKEFAKLAPSYSFLPSSFVMPTQDHFDAIRSDDLNWGTALSIPPYSISFPNFVDISRVTNLTALELTSGERLPGIEEAPRVSLTDRLLKSWSELASAGKAFKHLRLLVLHNQIEVTKWFFSLLEGFPSLVAVLVVGCPSLEAFPASRIAAKLGWQSQVKHPQREERTDLSLYLSMLGLDKDESGGNILPLLKSKLPGGRHNVSTGLERQTWFRRPKSSPVKQMPSIKRKVESAEPEHVRRQKKPTLRPSFTKQMQENISLAEEFLSGNTY